MSKQLIRIKSGSYRNFDASGQVFELVNPYKTTPKGGHVTVKNGGVYAGFPEEIRIKIDGFSDYEMVSESDVQETEQAIQTFQTDEERMEDIAQRFEILHDLTKATINGDIRAMIVSGPPGMGKSYGVEREIARATGEIETLFHLGGSSERIRSEIVKGSASPLGLYQTLYKYSDRNSVVVLDDVDSVLFDDVSLNLLKGALDSGKSRRISWLSDSHTLRNEGIPTSFNFNGGIIFLTNIKFDKIKVSRLKDHLDALQSRCHYLDLTLDTQRDKILRIRQIAKSGDLFGDMNLSPLAEEIIIDFIDENKDAMRELSLRTAIKIAQLYKSFPTNWESMARATCMKPA